MSHGETKLSSVLANTSFSGSRELSTALQNLDPRWWKFLLFGVLLVSCSLPSSEFADVLRQALADAYIQVSSFVGGTLLLFYFAERHFRLDSAHLLKRHAKWQIPIAAVVGALPGCGGAIIIMTQYVLGRIGFGSMVAVLTSTMGDAAFLLLAKEPQTALVVMVLSVVAGTATGWVVEKIHGPDFLKKQIGDWHSFRLRCGEIVSYSLSVRVFWYGLWVPGMILGLGAAFQTETDAWFGPLAALNPTLWIGVAGALSCVWIWACLPDKGFSIVNLAAHPACRTHVETKNRVVFETSFVTVWVVFAFLVFELGIYWTAFDLEALFKASAPFVPLLAVLVGFIPGCGPQIIVTTLYLNGLVPFSAQIGNAISNDGDALFPAIALAPNTAILATLYTAIPALLLAYGFYFISG